MAETSDKILRFGVFTLDPNLASLNGPDGQLPLRPKAYDVLHYLVRNPGRVVSKDELIEAVWPNVFVTENSLVQCISDIRAALNDSAQTILKTVARRGYLFAAQVVEGDLSADVTQASEGNRADRPRDTPATSSTAVPPDVPARHRAGALRWIGIGAAVVAVALLWLLGWHLGRPGGEVAAPTAPEELPEALGRRISIAVLPLATHGAPPDEDYFADGLTEDIIAALGRFAELSVLSPKAVSLYKGKSTRPADIGRELKVKYIAEGSIRRSPERVRIAIGLTDAAKGTLLWSDQYDAAPADIFAIQDKITRQITGALAVQLTSVEQARIAAKPPSSLEAYDLVLRGRDSLSRLTRAGTSNARNMFERAAELDPNYAPAHIGLGRADLTAVALGWTPDPAGALHRAETLARKAISIDEFNPAAHVLLGRTYARLGEYERAEDALKRAVALNPSDPDSYAGLGDALLWTGDLDGAIKALETAVQLDPRLSTSDLFNLGTAYFLAGQSPQAVRTFDRTIARDDSTVFIHAMLAAVHAEAGRKDAADRAAAEVRRRNPFFDIANFGSLFRNPEHRTKIVSALQKAGF
jgi:TolB-like protein/DNA-binding winged helix-turn-helix (wHTH) protein/Flp pilus assembly protein TadD